MPVECCGLAPSPPPPSLDLMSMISAFRKPFPRSLWATDDPSHVIITGAIAAPNAVRNFLAQFYHTNHLMHDTSSSSPPMVVIMGLNEPTGELKELMMESCFEDRVIYFKVSMGGGEGAKRPWGKRSDPAKRPSCALRANARRPPSSPTPRVPSSAKTTY